MSAHDNIKAETGVSESLSPWWRHGVILTLAFGFTILIRLAVRSYQDAPPIPERIVSQSGETIFTREDILAGQQVFIRYGLMENGTIWGHGAYLGPDFSAEYLHTLTLDSGEMAARRHYNRELKALSPAERNAVNAEIQRSLKQNRYEVRTGVLVFTEEEAEL